MINSSVFLLKKTSSIAVQRELFDFGFKILFRKDLNFHHCTVTSIGYSLRLLKITGCQECYLFFELIKHVFLLTFSNWVFVFFNPRPPKQRNNKFMNKAYYLFKIKSAYLFKIFKKLFRNAKTFHHSSFFRQ